MTWRGLAVHPLVVLFCRWLRWGNLNNGLGNAGLSCGDGVCGLGAAFWNLGGRLSVTGNRGEYQAAA